MFFLKYNNHTSFLTLADRDIVRTFSLITGLEGTPLEKAKLCFEWIKKHIAVVVERKGEDQWQMPSETLKKRSGDCEDHAFLLTSFLLLSGVDAYFCRGWNIGAQEFHAFTVVVNQPKLGLNYWDTLQDVKGITVLLVFEAINQNGIANPLGWINFLPTFLPLIAS